MLYSWLYVSRCGLSAPACHDLLGQIGEVASRRNAMLDVTGGLLFTGTRFAQCLEGPPDAVRELQNSIRRDTRHDEVVDLRETSARERCFERWALFTVQNASSFVEQIIKRAIAAHASRHHASIDALAKLLIEFARAA